MLGKRFVLGLFVALLSMTVLMGGCGAGAPSTAKSESATPAATATPAASEQEETPAAEPEPVSTVGSPVGKYDPPITLSTIRGIEPSRTFMPDETWDNNLWTRAFDEKLGVKFDYVWTCPASEFSQKMNIAIASDDIPELMKVEYDQFYRLAAAGKLADITEAFDTYAGETLKRNMTEIADGVGLEMDKVNGKLYGIGNAPDYALGGHMLWFRNDWLKQVGKEMPKTWNDVLDVMVAFAKNDPNGNGTPTVGMGLSKSLWNAGTGAEGFFSAYGAYPLIWVENAGKVEFGAIQEQNREALLQLQKLFKEGVIDPEFSIKGDWDNYPDDMIKDKVGLEFGPAWVGDWTIGDIMANHPGEATWTCMEVPSAAGGIAKRSVGGKQGSVLCMRADTEHPEAMIKILNLGNMLMKDEGTAEGKYHDEKNPSGESVDNFFHYNDFVGGVGDDVDWNYKCAVAVTQALEAKDPSKLNPEQKNYYDDALKYLDGTDMKMYRRLLVFGPGGSMETWYKSFKAGNIMPDAFYGPNTDTMNAKLGNLLSKRDETFIRIIMGEPIEEFDKWVTYFNEQGGQEITKEVNDWYQSR